MSLAADCVNLQKANLILSSLQRELQLCLILFISWHMKLSSVCAGSSSSSKASLPNGGRECNGAFPKKNRSNSLPWYNLCQVASSVMSCFGEIESSLCTWSVSL